jgi:hypothetical protein
MITAIIGKPFYSGVFSATHIPLEFKENMTLKEAFKHQIENTRLLVEEDLKPDDAIYPVVWNGVIFRPSGNFYSSGMAIGDKLLIAYLVEFTDTPTPMLFEEKELDSFENTYSVIRVCDNIPVLCYTKDVFVE